MFVRKTTFLTTLTFYDTFTFIRKVRDVKMLLIVSIAIGLIGPGEFALDTLFGINLPQALLFGVLAVAALLVDAIGILSSRKSPVATHERVSRAS